MPTRVQNEPSGGLISYFYTDALTGKPITIAKAETQVVNGQSCIQLKELPYRFTRVRITNISMNEVDNADEVTNSNQFYVDYPNGMIYFYPSIGSATIKFAYDSIGYVYTTSTRIATQWNGTTVIETLQDMMNTMNHAILVSTTYATADDLIKDIEARTLVCNNSIATKISDANNKITDVNTAITNANTAKTDLETAISNGKLSNYQLKTDNTLATTDKTIVGGINEIETLKQNITDNGLNTVNKKIVDAINEIHDAVIPVFKTTVHLHANAGDLNCGTTTDGIPHNLGYKPSRVEAYIHGNDITGFHNDLDYIYQPSYLFFSHTDNISNGMYEITQVGVSELNIVVFIQRYSIVIQQAKDYTIDIYLYK